MLDNTIAAIATAPGEAGIGIVRVSGDKSIDILKKVFKPKRDIDIEDIPSRMMVYGYAVESNGETLDEVLAVIMRKPYHIPWRMLLNCTAMEALFLSEG